MSKMLATAACLAASHFHDTYFGNPGSINDENQIPMDNYMFSRHLAVADEIRHPVEIHVPMAGEDPPLIDPAPSKYAAPHPRAGPKDGEDPLKAKEFEVPKSSGDGMYVHVELGPGKPTLDIWVPDGATVSDLKQEIRTEQGLDVAQIDLSSDDLPLDDDEQTLTDWGINADSTALHATITIPETRSPK